MNTRFRQRYPYLKPTDEFEGGGGVSELEQDVDQGGDAAPAVPSTPEPDSSIFDAVAQAMETPEQKADRARDPLGRFAKTEAEAAAALVAKAPAVAPVPGAKPAVPGTPAAVAAKDQAAKPTLEELTQMPEGLKPVAAQRFQQLANSIKEVTQERDTVVQERDSYKGQVEYVKEIFQSNGVKPEQFDQATAVIGMMNKGDLDGALRVLDQQREMIALALGRPLPGVDPLSQHQDLRQAVDGYQITEERALEIARHRAIEDQRQNADHQAAQRRQSEQQAQQQQQAAQQEHQQGARAVDDFCKRMAARDLDYPAIEEKLLPHLTAILKGVPPSQWVAVVDAQYKTIKQVAGQYRRSTPSTGATLRATGHESPGSAPTSALDAVRASLGKA